MHALTVFDVRSFEPRFRHALIFSMFEGLTPGSGFVLVTDHDPVSLRKQFKSLDLPNLDWEYLEQGPDFWRIRIMKGRTNAESHDKERCRCTRGGHD